MVIFFKKKTFISEEFLLDINDNTSYPFYKTSIAL